MEVPRNTKKKKGKSLERNKGVFYGVGLSIGDPGLHVCLAGILVLGLQVG